ncbi:hypothetical protein LZG04_09910 [Saccharothrix sp. S26]|uniref:hypothetical protein n=1 Tax=Saccharothrix sp. S26 TaxID=2907215 RepID=UPI001F43AE27|nr:hypothetical protein [Saccharothrix sp. S26]MCE6995122.1 hypothetical protein [Saccharothrix sp. S26]
MLRLPAVAALTTAALSDAAPAHAEPGTLHVPGEVHLATMGTAGATGVAHTTRRADGTWTGFSYTGTQHSPHALVSAVVNDEQHLLFEDASGLPNRPWLHHRIGRSDGSWSEVSGPPDSSGWTAYLAVAGVAGELHRIRRSIDDARLTHHVRHADGTWSSATIVPAASTANTDVGLAGVGGNLRLVINDTAGGRVLPSYLRYPDGQWVQTSDVPFTPAAAEVTAVGVRLAQVGSELHAVVYGSDRKVYHAVQRSTGEWTTFHDVASQTGAPGSPVSGVSITASLGALHLAVSTQDNRLLHTIRFADGRWLPFGDVLAVTGSPASGPFGVVITGS